MSCGEFQKSFITASASARRMPATSESKASRTARVCAVSAEPCAPRPAVRRVRVFDEGVGEGCDCVRPCAGVAPAFGVPAALPLAAPDEGAEFVFEFCANATDANATTSGATKINFLNIAEDTFLKTQAVNSTFATFMQTFVTSVVK